MRNGKITLTEANEMIKVGSDVYAIENGRVVPRKVLAVRRNNVKTDKGILLFRDHLETWYITEMFARLEAKKRREMS